MAELEAVSEPLVKPARRLTSRRKAFLEAYLGPANKDHIEAAKIAGFAWPEISGIQLLRQLRHLIEAEELRRVAEAQMQGPEVIERLTTIGRKDDHKDHVRALELLAKIHGLLTDKLDLKLDKRQLATELEAAVSRMLEQSRLSLPAAPEQADSVNS